MSGPILVAIVGGTILTVGPQGTIEKGTVLIRDGRIAAVGRDVQVPAGTTVIDATGRFVMPGIIDAHSHTAVEEGVNECTDSVTAEVRVADVIDHHDVGIYRELAGGVPDQPAAGLRLAAPGPADPGHHGDAVHHEPG